MYKALFESHLRYSDELWDNLSNTKLQQLQRLQNRAKTLIENSRSKDGWRCNWLSVSNITQFDKAVMIYEIVNSLCLDSLRGRCIPRSQLSRYTTRNQLDLDIPRLHLEFSKNNFFYSGVKTWNNIPLKLDQIQQLLCSKGNRRSSYKISILPEAGSLGRPVNPCFPVSLYLLLDVNAL